MYCQPLFQGPGVPTSIHTHTQEASLFTWMIFLRCMEPFMEQCLLHHLQMEKLYILI